MALQGSSAAVRAFYRKSWRLTHQLPRAEALYYRGHLRNHVANHREEEDEDRILSMLARAEEDLKWLSQKYELRLPE